MQTNLRHHKEEPQNIYSNNTSVIHLFHTGPKSHELPPIDKYLASWLKRTQFVKTLYPYSTQVMNRTDRHKLIFLIQGGGIREVSLFFSPIVMFYTSQSRFRYDVITNIPGNRLNSAGIAKECITISKITLEHAARKLRKPLRIS